MCVGGGCVCHGVGGRGVYIGDGCVCHGVGGRGVCIGGKSVSHHPLIYLTVQVETESKSC